MSPFDPKLAAEIVEKANEAWRSQPTLARELDAIIPNRITADAVSALDEREDIQHQLNSLVNAAKERARIWQRREAKFDELLSQTTRYRGILFGLLMSMMALETLVLFVVLVLASLDPPVLAFREKTLEVTIGATIAQIGVMVVVIVKSVFPPNLKDILDLSGDRALLAARRLPARGGVAAPAQPPEGSEGPDGSAGHGRRRARRSTGPPDSATTEVPPDDRH